MCNLFPVLTWHGYLEQAALGVGAYIVKLQNDISNCENRNNRLQDRNEELKEEIKDLQSQLKQKNQKIQELESKEKKD